jgi:mannose PTS system EIIAB component
MVSMILVSHGELAGGVRQSASMVFGAVDNVPVVSLKPQMGPDDFRAELLAAVESLGNPKQLLILADLWGGTPFNQSRLLCEEHEGWCTVTGLSLPVFIEAYSSCDVYDSAAELVAGVIDAGWQGTRVFPEDLQPELTSGAPAQQAQAATGSKLGGSGVLPEIAWCRIDSRLLHGQVAMAWSKQICPTRIVVVSDGVAHDELRKTLITEAAPPGTRANVVPVDKMVQILNDDRFAGQKFLLLFENPQDVLRVVEQGVKIPLINIGGMAHSTGKTIIGSAVSVNKDDVACFEKLRDAGCEFCVQKVPTDKDEKLWELIAKTEIA